MRFKFIHSGERSQKVMFSVFENIRVRVDGRPNQIKNGRFQIYPN